MVSQVDRKNKKNEEQPRRGYERSTERGTAQNSQGNAGDLSSQPDDLIDMKEQIFAQRSVQ